MVLEDKANVLGAEVSEGAGIERERVGAVEGNFAGGGRVECAQDVEQSGFARTAGAEDGQGIAGIQSEIDAAQDDQWFIGSGILLVQVGYLEAGCHCRSSS